MKQFKIFIVTFAFSLAALTLIPFQLAIAQVTIQGSIHDEVTGEPINGTNIFLEGTTDGSSSGVDGKYSFKTELDGKQVLIASFIGYHTVTYPLNIDKDDGTISVDIKMRVEQFGLDDIIITADNREWQSNFDDFKREFLGGSSFALNSEILNKWAIDFIREPNGELYASAREPVLVENRALGYWIEVDLHDFRWKHHDESGYYLFRNISFEEMKPQTETDLKRWESNRERAYRGSFRHFLTSLYNDRLSRNRFSVVAHQGSSRTSINELERSFQVIQILMAYRIPAAELGESVKVYHLREPLDVVFGARGMGSDTRPRATIIPRSSNNTFIVHRNGYLIDGRSLSLDGIWKNTRIANMLPPDYLP